jgi:hypothetical protein
MTWSAFLFSTLLIAPSLSALAAATEEDLFFKGTASVNEGQLRFLEGLPDKPLYHFRNHVLITDSSLDDGWVRITQCHENLDAVPNLQIVYGAGKIRNLVIRSSQHVGRSWVEANSVQMQDLRPGASVCISAESRTLEPDQLGGHILKSGPYMRRFLDGFYPMRVSLTVELASDRLRYENAQPSPQPGFSLRQLGREIRYEAYFEGMLRTELRFSHIP